MTATAPPIAPLQKAIKDNVAMSFASEKNSARFNKTAPLAPIIQTHLFERCLAASVQIGIPIPAPNIPIDITSDTLSGWPA